MSQHDIFTRIRLLGVFSLAALFGGGLILVLAGLTAFLPPTPADIQEVESPLIDGSQRVFLVFAHLSIRVWFATLAVSCALLWYGFHQAYVHLSACRCGNTSTRGPGLDDNRHADSIARTPMLLIVRYLFPILCIVAAVGYEFGLVQIDVFVNSVIDRGMLKFSLPPPLGSNDTVISPWTPDGAWTFEDQLYFHEMDPVQEPGEPPSAVVVSGVLDCQSVLRPLALDMGVLTTREIVMVANLTNDDGSFEMTRDHNGWMRTRTSNKDWFDEETSQDRAVVDYRIVEPGKVQIQWARDGPWFSDDPNAKRISEGSAVARRITYDVHYAVALVGRDVNDIDEGCTAGLDVDLLVHDSNPPDTEFKNGSLPHIWDWVGAMLESEDSDVDEGVRSFLHAVMAGWGSTALDKAHGPKLRFLRDDEEPFGPEQNATWKIPGEPYYSGTRKGMYRGCYLNAGCVYLVVGCLAIIIGLARIESGPCDLPLEIGQDGYMPISGEQLIKEKVDGTTVEFTDDDE
ncbi:hypothetical protein BGZ61DRAFT_422899 [Ilyonectria robusta]|uniref:uncharacterized protein n=1 Tax=Ilyonectria robusta TaxID=1079257 RepID=UPI001E8CC897|nr:uncharacterized protein BGZ61DRAFT_422899 [Ilyonectria robusta]KAH8686374.1 hypothetical protein BGZ61DRAFT_422899 [Ilyonectria robusta]